MHIRNFDLNLIAIFEAVYEERNQSRAAERLGISQPAVSHALTRLRTTMNDHLFHDRAMNPTSMANDLYSQFHLGLNQIRAGVREIDQFDPASSHRHFSIAASYSGGAIYSPELYKRVKEEAPFVRLSLRMIDPASLIPDLLRQKNIDMAICHAHSTDTSLVCERVRDSHPVLITRRNHPLVPKGKELSMDDLWKLEYVGVHGEQAYYDMGEQHFLKQLMQERISFELPNAVLLMLTLVETDLASVTVRTIGEFAIEHFDVEVHDLPCEIGVIQNFLIWHRSLEWDTANQWLRNHIMAIW